MAYYSKPLRIDAIQWNGTVERCKEIKKFCGACDIYPVYGSDALLIDVGPGIVFKLQLNDWLITYLDFPELRSATNEQFKKYYLTSAHP